MRRLTFVFHPLSLLDAFAIVCVVVVRSLLVQLGGGGKRHLAVIMRREEQPETERRTDRQRKRQRESELERGDISFAPVGGCEEKPEQEMWTE